MFTTTVCKFSPNFRAETQVKTQRMNERVSKWEKVRKRKREGGRGRERES